MYMITIIVLLSIWLFFALVGLIMFGIEDSFKLSEWLTIILFVFCFPIWLVGKITVMIKYKLEHKKILKRKQKLKDEIKKD